MATQRYISTSFWDDAWVQGLDPSEKFLYLYLLTNPLTNIAGVYETTMRRICFDTGFNDDTARAILERFQAAGKAHFFAGYIILPSWPKHQHWRDRSKIKQGIDAVIRGLPISVVKYMQDVNYSYPIKGYTYPSNYSDSDLDIDSNTGVGKVSEKQREDPEALPRPDIANQLEELMTKLSGAKKATA